MALAVAFGQSAGQIFGPWKAAANANITKSFRDIFGFVIGLNYYAAKLILPPTILVKWNVSINSNGGIRAESKIELLEVGR